MNTLILKVVVGDQSRQLKFFSDSELSFSVDKKAVLADGLRVLVVETEGIRPSCRCFIYPDEETVAHFGIRGGSPMSLGLYSLPTDALVEAVEMHIDEPIDERFEIFINEKRPAEPLSKRLLKPFNWLYRQLKI